MDRKINSPAILSLFPAANGWHLLTTQGGARAVHRAATLAEAAELLPPAAADETIRLALPTRMAVFERFTLPSHDREELEGMIRNQLEKTLPYPLEETLLGFEILSRREADPATERGAEATVIAGAAHRPAVEALCAPLIAKGRYPAEVTFRALHAAAQAPQEATACGFWMEEEAVVFGIFERSALTFVEIVASPGEALESFPQFLLSAELAGASTAFSALLLDPALEKLRAPLEALPALAGCVATELCAEPRDPGPFSDLAPEAWRLARMRRARNRNLRRQCLRAALAYGVCIVLALAYLVLQGRRLRGVEAELAATRPGVDGLLASQARWTALAPAIDQRRFTVELLFHVFESLPSSDTRVTQFNQGKGDFIVQGESPNAAEAIALLEKLKAVKALGDFHLEAGQPVLLPNEHAQFSISGKL